MATEFAFVDDSGTTRLEGFLVPEPGLPTGAGSPLGAVTPSGIGELYIDTTNGGLYIAIGATDADWVAVGGNSVVYGAQGVFLKNATDAQLVCESTNGSSVLSDVDGQLHSGNGVYWRTNGTDGQQELDVFVGSNGTFTVSVLASGLLDTSSGAGVKFPTADPMVVGAWWNDSGVLTISAAT